MSLAIQLKKQNPYEKLVDDIMKFPRGAQRWRAAVNLWLFFNQPNDEGLSAKEENRITIEENNSVRLEQATKFGTSSANPSSSMLRYSFRIPEGALHYIELIDPTAFTKENKAKLYKEFPEYTIARSN